MDWIQLIQDRVLGRAVMNRVIKNAVFWDVAPCRSCVNRRF
jgi:hypothetical protein